MASVKTNKGREKLAKAHAGVTPLPAISHIAFGSGGVDATQSPKNLTGAETALFNEVCRKTVVQSFPDPYTSRYKGVINSDVDKLVGVNINEACLIDAEGDVVAIKTFTNKGMDERTVLEFDYDAEF